MQQITTSHQAPQCRYVPVGKQQPFYVVCFSCGGVHGVKHPTTRRPLVFPRLCDAARMANLLNTQIQEVHV